MACGFITFNGIGKAVEDVVRGELEMFIKILTKIYSGKKHYYASLVENKRVNGKVIQTVKANLGD